MMEPLMQGWLTKSPPEKKTQGPWKLFKAKWRRRFFVLYEIPAAEALPGQRAALVYFDSENRKHKLGGIDLSSCDEVQQRLESSFYQYVFSLRSKHKGKDRTYYLVSETEYEMNKWVDHLCCVLGLKETERERQFPTMSPINTISTVHAGKETDLLKNQHRLSLRETEPEITTQALPKDRREPEPYIFLDECWTGNEHPFTTSVASSLNQVSSTPADYAYHGERKQKSEATAQLGISSQPPPPPKHSRKASFLLHTSDTNWQSEMYDKPRSYLNQIETGKKKSSPHGTNVEEQCVDNFQHRKESKLLYDIPKYALERQQTSFTERLKDDYDIPPPRSNATNLMKDDLLESPEVEYTEKRYMNLPMSSKSHPKYTMSAPHHKNCITKLEPSTDAPLNAMTSEYLNLKLLEVAPPPPGPHAGRNHKYVNANSKFAEPAVVATLEIGDQQVEHTCESKSSSLNKLVMKISSATSCDVENGTKSEHHLWKGTENNEGKIVQNQYDVNKMRFKSKDNSDDGIEEGSTQSLLLFPNHRTRSFKRNICSSTIVDVQLPMRKEGPSNGSSSNEDTDDIDEEDSGSEVISKPFVHSPVPKNSLESTPPPPKTASEIQYLDLDLPGEQVEDVESNDGSVLSTKDCSQACGVNTDYREIDFIKTKALGIMKQDLEKKRKSSDKSSDEI